MTSTVSTAGPAGATSSKSEQAYAAVKASILSGEYSPGYRLVLVTKGGKTRVTRAPAVMPAQRS